MVLGELSKLVIRGFDKPDEGAQQGEPKAEFKAMFNPESFSVNTNFSYDESQAHSETGAEYKFQGILPREFSFEFIIDSTGATGKAKDIEKEINSFKDTTGFKEIQGFNGKERRPAYLSISWGTFSIRCVLKNMDIKYTLFRPDGKPIRAILCVTFAEYKTNSQKSRENPFSIRSLTQVRDVLGGDKLTDLAESIYGDAKLFAVVASANNLNSLRQIGIGSRLQFPPINQIDNALSNQLSSVVDQGQKKVQQAVDLAKGKRKDLVKSVDQLREEAIQQAQTLISDAEKAGGQLQNELEREARNLMLVGEEALNQGQALLLDAQRQTRQFGADLRSTTESTLRELQEIQRLSQDSLGDVKNELDNLSKEARNTTQDFFNRGQEGFDDTLNTLNNLFDF